MRLIAIVLLVWVARSLGACNFLPVEQYNALRSLYYATDGINWNIGQGIAWRFPRSVVTSTTPCVAPWVGVNCSCNSAMGTFTVTQLDLYDLALSGYIPSAIGNLTGLTSLDLGKNYLYGTIPYAIGNIRSLQYLFLYDNSLNGTIPSSIINLSKLEILNLNSNELTGSIPEDIGYLTALEVLTLTENRLEGTIPTSIGALQRLTQIYLIGNSLTGTIPSEIGLLTALFYLTLASNNLVGTIPSSIQNLRLLFVIELYSNQLTGTIPPGIGELTRLSQIFFYGNKLAGSIPSTIGNLKSVNLFDIYENELTGTLPSEICQMTSLVYLQLYANALSGTIPPLIGNLVFISIFDFHVNYLTGTIPTSIGDLILMKTLDLVQNKLTGTIPESIVKLREIQTFSLSNNSLTGTIPNGVYNLTTLQYLTLNDNSLTGTISSSIGRLRFLLSCDFAQNNFTGSIPASLWNLRVLELIYLNSNNFTGTLPSTFASYQKLQVLSLENNRFSGTIPKNLLALNAVENINLGSNRFTGTLPNLTWASPILSVLTLDSNYFTGTIPPSICQILNLRNLELGSNYLHGSIPSDISTRSYLFDLSLPYNSLTGRIPQGLGNITLLTFLNIGYNFVSGSIPASLFKSNLFAIYMNSNALSGYIPSSIGSSRGLNYLWLNSNSLSGSVPTTLDMLGSLVEILLHNNKLTGRFFDSFGNRNSTVSGYALSSVNIANNLFIGSISLDFSKFGNLTSLVATSNCLTGSIPSTICVLNRTLISLIMDVAGGNSECHSNLRLNKNKPKFIKGLFSNLGLSGTLPDCLFNIPTISVIHLAGNRLHGTIPSLLNPNSSKLTNLALSNNLLVGSIPTTIQEHSFIELDLANNKLKGTLIESFSVSSNQKVLGLAVNRLAGPLPLSLSNSKINDYSHLSLNILATNVFECTTSEVPSDDPNSTSYSCGSFYLNTAYIVFSVSVAIFAAVGLYLAQPSFKNLMMDAAWKQVRAWYSNVWTPVDSINETKGFLVTVIMIRNFAALLMCLCCVALLPVYIALNVTGSGSIVTHQYGHVVSMAYLHGLGIVIFISAFLFVVLLVGRLSVSALRLLNRESFEGNDVPLVNTSIKYNILVIVVVVTLQAVNVAVTVCINALYVNAILNSSSIDQSQFLVLQIAISAFKVFWNGLYVPLATKRLEKFITHSRAMQSRYVMSIVNFVVAPCIATVTVNQSCFYYVIVESNPISISVSSVVYNCVAYVIFGITCTVGVTSDVQSSAYPPFRYSYACGTALLVAYIPVLIYVYIFNSFLVPLIRITLALVGLHKDIVNVASIVGLNPDQVKGRNILVDQLIHATVLLTFGVCNPILGIEIGLSIVSNSTVAMTLVGRLIRLAVQRSLLSAANQNPLIKLPHGSLSKNNHSTEILLAENVTIKDSWRSAIVCADLVVFVVVTFWAWLCFDMIADVYGWVSGVICSVLFEVLIIGLIAILKYEFKRFVRRNIEQKTHFHQVLRNMFLLDIFKFQAPVKYGASEEPKIESTEVDMVELTEMETSE